ncbi:MAG: CoA-binding protein [Clostridiales bacterium]|nr:CoA-binding protein [Clostridiales bacterium]
MDLKEVMKQQSFVVVGDTTNPEKYAYKIKHQLIAKGYDVQAVGRELSSINLVNGNIDIIDLCIHPSKGIQLLRELKKPCKCVVIQPGAESDEIKEYLEHEKIAYLEGCLLVGLRLYAKQ